ncbi:hypothetical protein CXG47_02370 [Pseudomonas plecoglossicida]|uniref:Diguanylate cyclase n=1 Tax=Pseudomonas plecoglossicida TaxID=70775 RepID=A0ABX4UBT3_PSEDL|nr:hypothetical protein CXG48_01050 [Pseudomonas plecoglossicida]PLV17007.1 hypothetical protein CXG47_02370 [Pseudomonas plecoglossicida]
MEVRSGVLFWGAVRVCRADKNVACAGLFAGKPAPTSTALISSHAQYLWERVHPRKGRHRQQRYIGNNRS